ncbi:fluoride efflux transporter FluC [Leucobacter japonicus]|uniref:fluoride efflux transporter FluC n=1 Tax=Leucobacter japonicus TaxID=1461259 RepID=UPI0006A7F115|nr:CrcB family protein [Leucobacter japonicus]
MSRSAIPDLGVVAVGGAIGTLARYGITSAIGGPESTNGFPLATLLINLLGAFLLGMVVAIVTSRGSAGRWRTLRLLLGTGVLGGFTTYSLLATDLAQAALASQWGVVAGYAAATLIGGVIASGLGLGAGRALATRGAPAGQTGGAAS